MCYILNWQVLPCINLYSLSPYLSACPSVEYLHFDDINQPQAYTFPYTFFPHFYRFNSFRVSRADLVPLLFRSIDDVSSTLTTSSTEIPNGITHWKRLKRFFSISWLFSPFTSLHLTSPCLTSLPSCVWVWVSVSVSVCLRIHWQNIWLQIGMWKSR